MQRSTKFFVPAAAAVLVGGGLFLYSQGVRLDNQNLEPEPPSASEVTRQGLAELAAQISDGAAKNSLTQLASNAKEWEANVGGVWVAWPSGAPSGHTNEPVATTAPPGISPTELAAMLAKFSDDAGASGFLSASLGARLASVSLGGGCGTVDVAKAGAASASSEAVTAAEAARQWLEHDAAHTTGKNRVALIDRAESIGALQSAMISAGARDTRPAVVPLPEDPTNAALAQLTRALLHEAHNDAAREAILPYVCSLYITDVERHEAGALPGA